VGDDDRAPHARERVTGKGVGPHGSVGFVEWLRNTLGQVGGDLAQARDCSSLFFFFYFKFLVLVSLTFSDSYFKFKTDSTSNFPVQKLKLM
jgi:hypothetical protein